MDISVVIISFNSGQFLRNNLNSLINQTVAFKNIVIVDNNSTDNSLAIIEEFEGIEIVKLNYNSGYARGANIGIKRCDSDLILIGNSDIILDENFNYSVLRKFTEDRNVDLLSPLILRFDKETIDSAGQRASIYLYPKEIGFNKKISETDFKEEKVFSVCGAATVFSKKALEKLKIDGEYYDEDFFIFWEDFDIGWRANLYQSKICFFPEAVVYHFRSATLSKKFISKFSPALARSSEIKFHLIKNRYLVLIKNFRWRHQWWYLPLIIFKDIFWVTLLILSSPKIIIKLMQAKPLVKRALDKRAKIKLNE